MHLDYLKELIHNIEAMRMYYNDGSCCAGYEEALEHLSVLFQETKKAGKQVFFIGNGGSAAIAGHMTADFMKNGGMKTCSLYECSVITCMGNDYGYEHIFSYPLGFLGNESDLLVAISSSGNSKNIVNAIETALQKKMKVVTFSGFQKDNRICGMGVYNIHVPVCHYGMVESIHNLILQQIVDTILERDGAAVPKAIPL